MCVTTFDVWCICVTFLTCAGAFVTNAKYYHRLENRNNVWRTLYMPNEGRR